MIPKELLMQFCLQGDEAVENKFSKPYSDGKKTWACDTKMLLELNYPVEEFVLSPEAFQAMRFPTPSRIFDQFKLGPDSHPFLFDLLPCDPRPVYEKCDRCQGTGASVKCQKCDGEGVHSCSCGDEHDCHECKSTGWIPQNKNSHKSIKSLDQCLPCCGKGKVQKYGDMFVVDPELKVAVNPLYLLLAKQLPGAKLLRYKAPNDVCFVLFDEGRLAVMSMDKSSFK